MCCWDTLQAYLNKKISKNLWRVEPLGFEFQDLKQEAYIIYHTCMKQCSLDSDFFFSYFRNSFRHKLDFLSNQADEIKQHEIKFEDDENLINENSEEEMMLKVKLDTAPDFIKKVLDAIDDASAEELKGRNRGFNSNARLCELVGIKGRNRVNILKEIKEYIREG